MTPFLFHIPRADTHRQDQSLEGFSTLAKAKGYVTQTLCDTMTSAFIRRRPSVRRLGDWFMVGDLYPSFATDLPSDPALRPEAIVQGCWGRYVGVEIGPRGRLKTVLRDPSGALDALVAEGPHGTIIASDPPDWALTAVGATVRIDHAQVHQILHASHRAWDVSLLDGVTSVPAGAAVHWGDVPRVEQIWRPHAFVADGIKACADLDARVRDTVDHVVDRLATGGGRLVAELSGGLDSAIVAASLKRGGHPIEAWLHSFGADPEGDERPFAQAMAETLGTELDLLVRRDRTLTQADLETLSVGVRPGFNAMDPINDAVAADRLHRLGADRVFTGKGGDAVWLQAFGADVFQDLWRRQGGRALFSSTLAAAARWEGRSVWSVLAGRPAALEPTPPASFLTDLGGPALPHPWLVDAEDLGPAKRFQILGLADAPCFSTPSRQAAVADLVHPLLTQPVMELCLSIPAEMLAANRDRSLARRAFRDRLAPEIASRRSKGDLTAYYGRMISRSLGVLRPWILEGGLSQAGLIDRSRADQMLTAEHLIWRGGYREIMLAATVESWWRRWRSRLAA
jgi:asparagine synthase (glutamine-hydrolysing)